MGTMRITVYISVNLLKFYLKGNFGLLIHSNDERLIKKKIQFLIGIIETSLNNK